MQRGTSLVEVLIYIACTVVMCSLAGQLAYSISKVARERSHIIDSFVQATLALERLLNDIKHTDSHHWKKTERSALIFSRESDDCGWFIERGRLVRVTGAYDIGTQQWSKRGTSVLLDSIEAIIVEFYYDKQQILTGVRVGLTLKHGNKMKTLAGFVAVTEGVP